MFDYKHLQVQVAHPEACVVGPGVRKCVPNLPDTAAGMTTLLPTLRQPCCHNTNCLDAECLNCLCSTPVSWLFSSRAKISYHAAQANRNTPLSKT